MRPRTTREWVRTLEAAAVPCGPINDIAQVFEDPQVRHRGLRVTLEQEGAGTLNLVRSPIRLSATPVSYRNAPPKLGADTGAMLAKLLGKDEDEVARLRAAGVI